jgi:asparagine synthase (glutamine-hydrolysing)
MCGICGIYDYGQRRPVDEQLVGEMMEAIRHRGPDDDGFLIDGDAAIASRRLSIIDVEGGRQPISNEDGTVTVVCNGEIYNYLELRGELQSRGHTFSSGSDCEVIVHLYEERGDDCVHALRGMFGFAVWDSRRRKLLVARDRLGIKPMYYGDAGGRLVFGSELKAILQDPTVERRPDLEALSNFLSLKYVPAPQTMFAGLSALPPGHLLTCTQSGTEVRRYWDLSFAERRNGHHPEETYAEELAELLRDSVRSHLMSDVPFGAFLSGGVDSSTVVALMSQLLDEPVKTFAVGFEGPGEAFSELPYARMVADRYSTDHHEIMISPSDFLNLAEKVVWHLDQPIADDACLANFMVAELASRHVKMVLTGEGGDELFAGYARYAGERFAPVFRAFPSPARSFVLGTARRLPGLRRPKIALYALSEMDEVKRVTNWFPLFNSDMKAELIGEAMQREVDPASAEHVFAEHLARTDAVEPLHRMLYVDTKLWLPDDLLARGDKMSMASSLEARVPLLDHKLVEFAASLPPNLKLRRLTRKYLLKQVSRSWLPDEIIDRKKKGFPIPMSVWLRNEAKPFMRDLLSPDAVSRRGWLNPRYVSRLMDEHESRFADHGSILWGLINVELWARLYLDSPTVPRAPEARMQVGV